MQPRISMIAMFMMLLVNCGIHLKAQTNQEYLALITDSNGDVTVKRASRDVFQKARWGMQLFENDKVKTSESSSIQILFSNNSLIELGANSMLTISRMGRSSPENVTSILDGGEKFGSAHTMVALRETKDGEVGVLAGLRSGGTGQAIGLLSPRNTKLKTCRPTFTWRSHKDFEAFKLTVLNSRGIQWTRTTSETTLAYPEDEKPLNGGESYFWHVEGVDLIESSKSERAGFSTLTPDELEKVGSVEKSLKETFADNPDCSSYHFLLGACYRENGLLQDAIHQFEQISQLHDSAPLPHEILGHLYNSIGIKERAIAELKTAIELSRERE